MIENAKAYLVQITFYIGSEPISVQVTSVFAESRDEAEVAGYEVADDAVDLCTWDYGHDRYEVEVLGPAG